MFLELEVLSANHKTRGEVVELPNFLQRLEDLVSQFSRGGDNHGSHAIHASPLVDIQTLENRDEEGESLSTAGQGGSQNVFAAQGRDDGGLLDFGGHFVATLLEAAQSLLGQGKVTEGVHLSWIGGVVLLLELGNLLFFAAKGTFALLSRRRGLDGFGGTRTRPRPPFIVFYVLDHDLVCLND